jgi:uncharacterized membrane protein
MNIDELADVADDSVNRKTYGALLSQNLSLRVIWLMTGWVFSLTHRPTAAACFLLLGIVGTKFVFRSHPVSVVGACLGLLIFLHPFVGSVFENQPRLWTQDWLMSSVGFGFLFFLFIRKRQQIKFDSSIKYLVLVTSAFALLAIVAVMSLETQLWVLGAGYDNSTHFRDMYDSVAQPIVSFPFPSHPPRTFSVITGLFLRILGISSDVPTSSLLYWYLTSLFALTAAFVYASAKVIARNLESKILLLSGVTLLTFSISLTPVSQTFVAGNPTQVFSIFLVFYYLWPALLLQTRSGVNTILLVGSLYLVNASYPFTLVLLAPVVVARFADLTISNQIARNGQKKDLARNAYSSRQLFSLIAVVLTLMVAFFWANPTGQEFLSSNWDQFVARFSIVGGIEPYREGYSYVIAYLLLGLLLANFGRYKFRIKIGYTGNSFRDNNYIGLMGVGCLLVSLLIANYSETITAGGTYYAMKLSYTAAIISLVGVVTVAASFLQGFITDYQWKKSSSNFLTSKRTFSLGVLAVTAFLASGGYALHTVSQQSPGIFQRAYMGTIPKFISEFNDPGSSGVDSGLVAYAAQESRRLERPVFLVTGGVANRLATIWVNEISGVWSYRLWEAINHVPAALSVGDMDMAADHFHDLNMILITDDVTLLMRLRSEVPTLIGCTLDEINIGMCELQKQN